jgi:hypothetical protein
MNAHGKYSSFSSMMLQLELFVMTELLKVPESSLYCPKEEVLVNIPEKFLE